MCLRHFRSMSYFLQFYTPGSGPVNHHPSWYSLHIPRRWSPDSSGVKAKCSFHIIRRWLFENQWSIFGKVSSINPSKFIFILNPNLNRTSKKVNSKNLLGPREFTNLNSFKNFFLTISKAAFISHFDKIYFKSLQFAVFPWKFLDIFSLL